ncbi:hypothetical protein AGMMS49940_08790 [Spirochaetia bacterium]|nr:hypothetical protein AGMMS49940_08790 [Spirochaetia bacterium]
MALFGPKASGLMDVIRSLFIVELAGDYGDKFAGYRIYQPVFAEQVPMINTAGPVSGHVMFERFRFAGTAKRVAHDFIQKGINFVEDFFIFRRPLLVIGKGAETAAYRAE